MNININKAFKKTAAGNYFGWYFGFYVFTFKRPHGKWCCRIGRNGEWLYAEGYHGTYFGSLKKVKDWVKLTAVV
jgi:hypothetical protein